MGTPKIHQGRADLTATGVPVTTVERVGGGAYPGAWRGAADAAAGTGGGAEVTVGGATGGTIIGSVSARISSMGILVPQRGQNEEPGGME